MTRRRKALIAVATVVLLLVAAMVAVGARYRPMLLTGTGYAAHNACALHFLADRTDYETDLPSNPLVPYLRTEVDEGAGTAETSILGVGFGQTAHLSEYGCTLGERPPGVQHAPPALPGDSIGGSSSAPGSAPGGIALPVADDVPQEVRTALDAAGAHEGTRGLVLVHRGELLGERYTDGFGPDTRQLGWSMAKSVASTMVGRAQLEFPDAELDPESTALRPEWTDDRAQISLGDLLRMTSGLEWDEEYELGTPITRMLFAETDMAAFAASRPPAHLPGDFRQYSSGTTNIVCDLLHEQTGLGPELADVLLFDELGMDSAVLEADESGGSVCSSYLWATPRDWARFGQFALDDGVLRDDGEVRGGDATGAGDDRRLLPEGWMDYSRTVVPAAGDPEPYGAQWWVNDAGDGTPLRYPELPPDAFWASGHDGQYVVVVPSADLVVVRMGFSPGGTLDSLGVDALVADVADAVP